MKTPKQKRKSFIEEMEKLKKGNNLKEDKKSFEAALNKTGTTKQPSSR